jgi:hypothetical protein
MHRRGSSITQWPFARGGFFCFVAVLLSGLAVISCVSKRKAEADARAAFLAGQQQAAVMNRQKQLQGPTVTVLGEVRNALVPWTADLTLAKAVVAAQYYGRIDPTQITIQRYGKEIHCDPKDLLGGKDVQLEPNDVIELAH